MQPGTVFRGQFQGPPNGAARIVVFREQFGERVELGRFTRRFGAKAKNIRRLARFSRFQAREEGPDAPAGHPVHQHGLRGLCPRQYRTPGQRARIPGEDRIRSGIRHAAIDLSCKLGKTEPFPAAPRAAEGSDRPNTIDTAAGEETTVGARLRATSSTVE
ncbi:hypothetical protein [Amycolatopsis sp. MEPSY49]|uniref:hypothetical protein n=1 Tax=Amycolatopsis sp. MEPSY49 TaxID=3151600 RepID=UPI003EF9CE20